jgi:fructokinase
VTPAADSPRALVVGEALVDVLRQPGEEERRDAGGGPSNVALGLGRLRVATDLLTHIAPDDDGMIVLYSLIDAGVSLIPGSFSAPRTPTAVATLDSRGHPTYTFDITWSLPSSVDFIRIPELLHVGSYAAFVGPGADRVRDLAARAHREGALVSFDPNIRPALLGGQPEVLERFEELASLSTLVKLSDEDARWLYPRLDAEEVIERVAGLGARLVALTRGGDGSTLAAHGDLVTLPVQRVRVVDTVGAGDSYMAALIQCLLHVAADGPTAADLEWIGRRSAAAAAVTVGRRGCDPPWLAELDGRLVAWQR